MIDEFNEIEQKRGRKNWELTSNIYNQVCEELGYSNADINDELFRIRFFSVIPSPEEQKKVIQELHLKRDKIDTLYRQKIIELPTKHLKEILICHKKGLVRRTTVTLDVIKNELANRDLLGK